MCSGLLSLSPSTPTLPIEKSGAQHCFSKTLLIPPWKDEMEVSNCGKTGKHKSTQKPKPCTQRSWGYRFCSMWSCPGGRERRQTQLAKTWVFLLWFISSFPSIFCLCFYAIMTVCFALLVAGLLMPGEE